MKHQKTDAGARAAAMSCVDLDSELARAGKAVRILHFRALERLAVGRDTLCNLWRHDYGFGVAHVAHAGDGLYYPGEGDLHLILPVYEEGALVDLCAFRSGDPRGWLLRSGQGWALGVERGLGRHTWARCPLAVSPLEWLQQGATGLCVIDWSAPEVQYLRDVPHLVCSSAELAARLRSALARPDRLPEMSVGEISLAA